MLGRSQEVPDNGTDNGIFNKLLLLTRQEQTGTVTQKPVMQFAIINPALPKTAQSIDKPDKVVFCL